MTLPEFLLARIAEDEAAARNEASRRERFWRERAGAGVAFSTWDAGPGNPSLVLADLEAERQIVRLHESEGGHECPAGHDGPGDVYVRYEVECLTLRLLALPYADHPDYREEWKTAPASGSAEFVAYCTHPNQTIHLSVWQCPDCGERAKILPAPID